MEATKSKYLLFSNEERKTKKLTCPMCLTGNIPSFDISNTYLQAVYKRITNLKGRKKSQYVCTVCKSSLRLWHQLWLLANKPETRSSDGRLQIKTRMDFTAYDGVMMAEKKPPIVKKSRGNGIRIRKAMGDIDSSSVQCVVKQEPSQEGLDTNSGSLALYESGEKVEIEIGGILQSTTDLEETYPSHVNTNSITDYIVHRSEALSTLFECRYCTYVTNKRYQCLIHERSHDNDVKPHHCVTCDRRFHHSNSLINHLRTHTGDKPFHCDICKETFAYPKSLFNHKKTHVSETRGRL